MKKGKEQLRVAGIFLLLICVPIIVFSINKNPKENSKPEDIHLSEILLSTKIDTVAKSYDEFVKKNYYGNTPGAAVAIVKDTNVALLKGYGARKHGIADPVDIHTVFRLASVSKGFTGILTSILASDSLMDLDDKVKNYLSSFELREPTQTSQIAVRNILNHTTGLVPHAFDNLIEGGIALDDIIPRLREVNLCCPPGARYGYQNVAFSLIEKIVEQAQPLNFQELLHHRIFRPLGMHDASCTYEDLVSSDNVAVPHLRGRNKWFPIRVNKDYYSVIPAAGVNASISDMSKWLIALLGNNPQIISNRALDLTFEPSIQTPLKYSYTKYWKYIGHKYYGLGWRIYEYNGRKILYHGGYVRGYRAEIALCREENIGIAVLTNSRSQFVNMSIPVFFNMYFDLEDPMLRQHLVKDEADGVEGISVGN